MTHHVSTPIRFFVRLVTLYTIAIARRLYQQIGPEKLLSLVDQCFLYVILNLEDVGPHYGLTLIEWMVH